MLLYPLVCPLLCACANALVLLDIRRDFEAENKALETVLAKRSAGLNSSMSTREIALQNSLSYYKTELLIGSPPQRVAVQIDTGSSDLWVISSTNPLCQTSHLACAWSSTFDAERSQTFQANRSQPFGITYGDNTFASGYFAQDDIVLGGAIDAEEVPGTDIEGNNRMWRRDASQFIIKSANFALAERANSSEAVWGVGMESTESIARHIDKHGNVYPTYPNLPSQMKQQGLIDTVAYSLWLNDLRSSTGSLLFGGVNHAKYTGTLSTVPLVSSYRGLSKPLDFSVMLNGISLYNGNNQNATVVQCSIPVLLDSGTTYSQFPLPLLLPVAKALGAYHDTKNNMFLIDGNKKRQLQNGGLSFNLSGIEINVPMQELLIPATPLKNIEFGGDDSSSKPFSGLFGKQKEQYVLGILPMDENAKTAYILGDTFLRSAYVVYDLENKQIALANAVHNATTSSIEEINSNGIPSATQAPLYSSTKIDTQITSFSVVDLFNAQSPQRSVSTVATGYGALTGIPSFSTSANTLPAVTHGSKTNSRHHGQKNSAVKTLPACLYWLAAYLGALTLI